MGKDENTPSKNLLTLILANDNTNIENSEQNLKKNIFTSTLPCQRFDFLAVRLRLHLIKPISTKKKSNDNCVTITSSTGELPRQDLAAVRQSLFNFLLGAMEQEIPWLSIRH
jgi:hypothetical protein